MKETEKKYPEGHFVGMWIGIGVAIFSGIGVPLSIITGNLGYIGIGPAIGAAFGLSVGQSSETRYRNEGRIRPLTYEEKKRKEIVGIAGVSLLLTGVVLALVLLVLRF